MYPLNDEDWRLQHTEKNEHVEYPKNERQSTDFQNNLNQFKSILFEQICRSLIRFCVFDVIRLNERFSIEVFSLNFVRTVNIVTLLNVVCSWSWRPHLTEEKYSYREKQKNNNIEFIFSYWIEEVTPTLPLDIDERLEVIFWSPKQIQWAKFVGENRTTSLNYLNKKIRKIFDNINVIF